MADPEPKVVDIPQIGIFIRNFLRQHREASPAEIHRSYKDTYRGQKTSKGNIYKLGTYQSHAVYIAGLVQAGLVERLEEGGDGARFRGDDSVAPERSLVKLTSKGERAGSYVWDHPLRLWYRPYDWEVDTYREYIKS